MEKGNSVVVEGGKIMLWGLDFFCMHFISQACARESSFSQAQCKHLLYFRVSSSAVGLLPHIPSIGNNCIFLTPQKIS